MPKDLWKGHIEFMSLELHTTINFRSKPGETHTPSKVNSISVFCDWHQDGRALQTHSVSPDLGPEARNL
jgi:hypothetical protein